MTRHVNFSSHQRVDLADMQAEAEFRNQDLRRLMRQIILGGPEQATRVISGFSTEPENPGVSSKILIKMDMGGGYIGSFMGAENYGPGAIDFGQVAGGKDAQGNLDGSAQALVDFAGQPTGTYTVKLKFSFVKGVSDNRAFWNPSTNSEYIKSTQTRLLPQWEAAITGHSDPEWVPIAEVNWGGASIDSTDIIDIRDLALEGKPRNEVFTPLRWSHPDQESATNYGVGDFDRGADRSDPAVNRSAIWQMLRAHARQIQDIKGPRDLDFRFDWFSRPHQPAGFQNHMPEERTKSLRTVDTVTFTIGDGLTEPGDFNGVSGLVDCMKFIQDYSVDLPSRIRIILKSKATVSGVPLLTWDKNITIDGKHIEIVGRGNGYNIWPVPSEFDGAYDGHTIINVAIPPGTYALHMTGNSGLYLKNQIWAPNPVTTTNFISLDRSCAFRAENVWFSNVVDGSGISLRCPSERCFIDNCVLTGQVFIGGKSLPTTDERDSDLTWKGGIVRNSVFWTCLVKLRLDETISDAIGGRWLFANRLRFQNCEFIPRSVFYPANQWGMIDTRGSRNVTFDQCHIQYNGDEDGVRIGLGSWFTGAYQPTQNIAFRDCQFLLRGNAYHLGNAGGAGGVNGTEGTGWAIKSNPSMTPTIATLHIPRGILIDNCEFRCNLYPTDVVSSPDAGAVALHDTSEARIKNCRIVEWTAPVDSTNDNVRMISVTASAAGYALGAGQHVWVDKNFIGKWKYLGGSAKWGSGYLNCIYLGNVNIVQVTRNHISAVNVIETAVADPNYLGAALLIGSGNNIKVEDNQFILWRSTADPLNNSCVALLSIINALHMNRNNFYGCGGHNIFAQGSATVTRSQFNDNFFGVGDDDTKFAGPLYLNCATDRNSIHNNWWDHVGTPAPLKQLHLGTGLIFSIIGNQFVGCNVVHATLGGGWTIHGFGYSLVAGVYNDVAGYV